MVLIQMNCWTNLLRNNKAKELRVNQNMRFGAKHGEHITWTGQGRMPNVFKVRIEAGETLDTFLIDRVIIDSVRMRSFHCWVVSMKGPHFFGNLQETRFNLTALHFRFDHI